MDYEELIHAGFTPQLEHNDEAGLSCVHLEITRKGTGTMKQGQTRHISQTEILDWIEESAKLSKKVNVGGGLHLIMGPSSSKDRHKTRSETLSYDDTGDENGNDKLALRAPFTEYNFKKVQEKFCLPPATPWAIRSQHPHFEQHIMEIADATIGFTMRKPSRRNTTMNIALSISHDTATRLTRAVLIGLSERDQESLSLQLEKLSNYSFHPLLLPTLLTCRHEFLLHEQVDVLYFHLLVNESLSRQTLIPSPDFEVPTNTNIGQSAQTKRALSIAQVALPSESEAQALIQGIDSIRKSIAVVDKLYADNSDQPEDSMKTKAATAAKLLGDYLDCCSARAHTALWDFQFLSKRANALMNALYGYAARETAIATKRDGTAMKAIALLTMFFLPATFFAIVFTMPLLDVSAPPGQPVVGSRFWMYWACVVPVTFLVLALYVTYTLVDKRLEAKEQRAAKEDPSSSTKAPQQR
ncbi:hypothetical protein NA56DRAFT_692803 [Hyaloscypha hepaticicola]|uniref:Cora-domain-containing protein n=1 Tax=Hyaloscypha hepaticicola TaxID=2082293 RepID=A0A2J6PPQ6_9HELO|nr:hypothetical protein NA56DRAFT_692803 [Hyaloscypha hepaticicola]